MATTTTAPAETYDLSKPIGIVIPPAPVAWNNRDLLLYAMTIGSHKTDYDVIYEKAPNYASFPTYPVVLSFKGDSQDVVDFAQKFGNQPQLPGLPAFDPTKLVQGAQSIEVIKPLPRESGEGWTIGKKIVGTHESTVGVTVDYEFTINDPTGVTYTRLITTGLNLGGVANGVPFDKTIETGLTRSKELPADAAEKPDWVLHEPTLETQAAFYRLNGDYNPLHIDPKVGEALGYGGLICHGLLIYAIAARSLIFNLADGDVSSFHGMNASFSGPVVPGDTVDIKVWELGPGPKGTGTTEFAFEARALKTGVLCLGDGVALIKKCPDLVPHGDHPH